MSIFKHSLQSLRTDARTQAHTQNCTVQHNQPHTIHRDIVSVFHFDEMATNLESVDEDYIDMELISSSPQNREFEFQMPLTCNVKETITSPADELFNNGKLLPLLLPPRRLMVQNFHHTTTAIPFDDITKEPFEEDHYSFSMPLPTCSTAPCTNTLNTPLDSCNISPSGSCRVSCELNPDDYFFEWSTELSSFIGKNQSTNKPLWSKKLKMIKHSILGQKLKASRVYLKSLFSKSACSDETSAKADGNAGAGNAEKVDESSNKFAKFSKKKPFGQIGRVSYPTIASIIRNMNKDGIVEDNAGRRSFSGAIKQHSPAKCFSSSLSNSSSSSSINSNGSNELQFLRRRSSAKEIEGSIQAAIAHCKRSQQSLD